MPKPAEVTISLGRHKVVLKLTDEDLRRPAAELHERFIGPALNVLLVSMPSRDREKRAEAQS